MCAIFGVYGSPKAAELTVVGLHANQHRAKDYAGVVSSDGTHLYRGSGKGLASVVFDKATLDSLHGRSAIGHIRYPTVYDDPTRDNTQPILGRYNGYSVAVAHNGNLTNAQELRTKPGMKLATSMDTELIVRLLEANCTGDVEHDIITVCGMLKGSFSLAILLPDRLIAVRDKSGNRPLSIGKAGDAYFLSSETCAFPNVGATHLRDVDSGSMVTIDSRGMRDLNFGDGREHKCRFEGFYYAHPCSKLFGENIGRLRLEVGRRLEQLYPVKADIVTAIPDSSIFIARGYGESGRSGKYCQAIIRNHYAGRTFIAATQAQRDEEVAKKFIFDVDEIRGRRVVVVDDSIVRGTTMPKIVRMLRQLHALEVHIRIAWSEFKHRCIYGINTPTKEELISARLSKAELCKYLDADSLEFMPVEGVRSLSLEPDSFCYACATGKYW